MGNLGGDQPLFTRVTPENIAESCRDNHPKPVVFEGPHGVLTGRAGPKIRPDHQHGAVTVRLCVEDEFGVFTPVGEESIVEAGFGDAFEVHGWEDLVGVHV